MLLVRMARRQDERGHSVDVIINRNSPALDALRATGLDISALPIGGKANPLAIGSLLQAVRCHGCQLVHSHLSSASWWCGWMERCGGSPSLGHAHGFTSAMWHRGQSHVVTCSNAVKSHLVSEGIPDDRITPLLNPVDPSDVVPRRKPIEVRDEFGAAQATPIVACFAHFSEKKGWRYLLKAAPEVIQQFPSVQIWCVGDGPLRSEMKRQVAEAGMAQRFRFPGFRHDVADLMSAVDVVVLPSYREPFGLVYVEAALLGKPVVGCRSGGTPEVVLDRETGILVPPRTSEALSDALCELLDNRQMSALMGRAGRDVALDRFNWRNYLCQLDQVYERVLGARSRENSFSQVLQQRIATDIARVSSWRVASAKWGVEKQPS